MKVIHFSIHGIIINLFASHYRHPRPPVLGSLLSDLMRLNERLRPYLEQYHELMNDDPRKENVSLIILLDRLFHVFIIV